MAISPRIVDRLPTVEEYLDLAESVGWSRFVTRETAGVALPNSLFSVVAEADGHPLGMGRVIGDGALFFYIQDVLVKPQLQGRHLGEAIMSRLMAWLDSHAPDRAFVGLFSSLGKAPFYARFGVVATQPDRPGMSQYLRMPDEAAT